MEKMYTELIRDNHQLIDKLGDKEIAKVVNLLKNGDRNPDYLSFLQAMCECEEQPVVGNQNKVALELLEKNRSIVYLTEVDHSDPKDPQVTVSLDGGKTTTLLRSFCATAMDEDDSTSTPEYLFLQGQLDLFGTICRGRNAYCIELISERLKYLTWEECFLCAKGFIDAQGDPRLPYSLRLKYVELIMWVFVDVGDNADVLRQVSLCYDWKTLAADPFAGSADDDSLSMSGARFAQFGELSRWISTVMAKDHNQHLSLDGRPSNLFLGKVVQLTADLVRFGYYTSPTTIIPLLKSMRGVLNGFTDVKERTGRVRFNTTAQVQNRRYTAGISREKLASVKMTTPEEFEEEWRSKGRYEKSRENEAVIAVKIYALDVIDALLNFCTSVRMQSLIFYFKQCTTMNAESAEKGKSYGVAHGRRINGNLVQAVSVLTRCSQEDALHQRKEVDELFQQLIEVTDWVTPGWKNSDPARRQSKDNLTMVEILLDLARFAFAFDIMDECWCS